MRVARSQRISSPPWPHGGRHGLAHPLNLSFRVVNVPSFPQKRLKQHHVRKVRRLRHEDVRHHEEIELLQAAPGMLEVRVRHHRVLADDHHGFQTCRRGASIISVTARPFRSGSFSTPQALAIASLMADPSPSGILCRHWQRAHVAGALHVVLAPEGIHPTPSDPHIAAKHGQVCEGLDVVRSVMCWVMPMA